MSRKRPFPFRALLLTGCLLVGCGGQNTAAEGNPAPEPETVDVKSSISVSTDSDTQAAPPRKGMVGVLPSDFPRDLPIYVPSSIIDFGRKDGRRFVLLQSPDGRDAVETWLRRALGQAGFKITHERGKLVASKGERRHELSLTGQSTTEFRYDY